MHSDSVLSVPEVFGVPPHSPGASHVALRVRTWVQSGHMPGMMICCAVHSPRTLQTLESA